MKQHKETEEMNLPIYEVTIGDDPDEGIIAITLSVDDTAFKKVGNKVALLIPNFKVYRNNGDDGDKEYFLYFSEKTIKELKKKFDKGKVKLNYKNYITRKDTPEFPKGSWIIESPDCYFVEGIFQCEVY